MAHNPFNSKKTLSTKAGEFVYYDLGELSKLGDVSRLPFSIRVLLESMLRNVDGFIVTQDDVSGLASYDAQNVNQVEMPFMPGRVVLQDFTGVPCLVDLAAMRDAMKRAGRRPHRRSTRLVPVRPGHRPLGAGGRFADRAGALTINAEKEFERNRERYDVPEVGAGEPATTSSVVPPATGIVHQVNLEYLAKRRAHLPDPDRGDGAEVYLPRLARRHRQPHDDDQRARRRRLGRRRHRGRGRHAGPARLHAHAGGHRLPLTGQAAGGRDRDRPRPHRHPDAPRPRRRREVRRVLRRRAWPTLSLPDRATIANMAPEYGATMGFFPVDAVTLDYLRLSGKREEEIEPRRGSTARRTSLFWTPDAPEAEVHRNVLELDLSTVKPSLAGPKRPQDRIALSQTRRPQWHKELVDTFKKAAPSEAESTSPDRWVGRGRGRPSTTPTTRPSAEDGQGHAAAPSSPSLGETTRTAEHDSRLRTAPSSSPRSRAARTPRTPT